MFAFVVVALTLARAGGSLADPDVWWHVRTGRLILDTHRIPHTDPFSFTASPHHWVPTAWLSDVLFSFVSDAAGVEGLRVLRLVLAVSVVSATWLVARRFATTTADAALASGLAVLALSPFLRERPQVLALLFVAWLAVAIQRVIAGEAPRLLTWTAVCWLWANVHGMWVLLPVSCVGAGLLAFAADRAKAHVAARSITVAVVSWAAVLVTPVGPRLAWWPLVVHKTAAPITEWQPTVLTDPAARGFLLLLAVVVVRWTLSSAPVALPRVAYVLAVSAFALLAFRNVAPAAVLLVPELARSIAPVDRSAASPRTPRYGLVALTLGLVLAGVHLAISPAVSSDQPIALVDRLASRTGELRLLNHYDVGGLVTGRASPPARVAIDGRTDIWSAGYVRRYVDALNSGAGWRQLVDDLRPTAALMPRSSEIAQGLMIERRWRVTDSEGSWVLLEPPR